MLALDQNILVIIFPLFFIAIFLCCFGIFRLINIRDQKKKFIEKIQQDGYDEYEGVYKDNSDIWQSKNGSLNPLVLFFNLLGNLFIGGRGHKSGVIDKRFLKGGLRNPNIEKTFWGAKIFFPFVFLGGFIVLKMTVYKVASNSTTAAIVVLGSLLAFYLPDIWLKQITDKRKERLLKGLPDSLDLLVVCVEAGMGLDSALKRVGDELQLSYPDLSDELHFLNLEMRAGKQRRDALKNFAMRTGLSEIKSLVTLLIQTDKFGTSVTTALKVFSDSFRTQRFQRAEEKAAKLPVSILIPLILFIFPSLFVVILGPAAINIYNNLLK